MLNKILELEKEIGVEGFRDSDESIFRIYSCKPNYNLKKFLNTFTDDYYNDMGFEEIEDIVIIIYKDYNVSVTCWNDEGEQINDDVLIKTNNEIKFFLFMFMSMKSEIFV